MSQSEMTVDTAKNTALAVLLGVSCAHLLNDAMQSSFPQCFRSFSSRCT
nr:hypothetical protein [Paenibacillus cineris]